MTAAALAAAWAAVLAPIEAQARVPPPRIEAAAWAEVADGRVARRTVRGEPATVVGVGILDVPRPLAWLSLTDDALSASIDSLTEVALEGRWSAPKLLYSRLDLPWPFADRHWVIALANNPRLATSAGVWERSWTVRPDALAAARARTDAAAFDAAEAVAVNEGSWLLLALDAERTLAVYQARATLGGGIPDGAVDAYTRSSLDGLYAGIADNAARVARRYGPGCTPQPGGDGAPIPCLAR